MKFEESLEEYYYRTTEHRQDVHWSPQPGSQEDFIKCPVFECLLTGTRGSGKSQPLTSQVLTYKGYKNMGDLKVGEILISPTDNLSEIKKIFPQGKREVYRLIFSDGSSVLADLDHLWACWIPELFHISTGYRIYTTRKLKKQMDKRPVFIPKAVKKNGTYEIGSLVKLIRIESAGSEECQCIKVDTKDGLYVTNDLIVTHNTDALIFDFAMEIGTGLGSSWRGVIFRKTYKQLQDIISRTRKWFTKIYGNTAKYNGSEYRWTFEGGEELYLRYIDKLSDYDNYHGWELGWIGHEELANWSTPDCYDAIKTICRSSDPRVRKRIRATTNPYGRGFGWIKERFIDPAPFNTIIRDENGSERVAIHGSIQENRVLLNADPDYLTTLKNITDPNKRKAWLIGSWDIVAGGALDDLWDRKTHIMEPFTLPTLWIKDMSFDWGSAKPFAVCFWAESDGSPAILADGTIHTFPRGTVFLFDEIYGWNGKTDTGCHMSAYEIAGVINKKIDNYPFKIYPGPADTNIWNGDRGETTFDKMKASGIKWRKALKGQGSRIAGLDRVRDYLKASLDFPVMEKPGLFVFNNCTHWIRTVPVIPRDDVKMDETDTDFEDHMYDATVYRLASKQRATTTATEI